MLIFGRIICFFKGHKRGTFLHTIGGPVTSEEHRRVYQCPRCHRETRYKVKDQNRGTPGDQS